MLVIYSIEENKVKQTIKPEPGALKYTAILRTLNHSSLVQETIAALRLQTLPPQEIIIVDSGSEAWERNTLERLADHFIDVSFRPFNYSFSINIGIFNCHTSCALVISSHVKLIEKTAIEMLMRRLTSTPELCAAYIASEPWAAGQEDYPAWEESIIDASSFTGRNGLSNACSLLRCADIRRHPFPEEAWAAEDQAWCVQEFAAGRKTLRVLSRDMHYKNPRINEKKRRNEQLAIACFVNPQDGSWQRIIELLFRSLLLWLRGRGTKAKKTISLAKGLTGLKFGKVPKSSRYF